MVEEIVELWSVFRCRGFRASRREVGPVGKRVVFPVSSASAGVVSIQFVAVVGDSNHDDVGGRELIFEGRKFTEKIWQGKTCVFRKVRDKDGAVRGRLDGSRVAVHEAFAAGAITWGVEWD